MLSSLLRPSSSPLSRPRESQPFTFHWLTPLRCYYFTQEQINKQSKTKAAKKQAVQDTPEREKTGGSLRGEEAKTQAPKEESSTRRQRKGAGRGMPGVMLPAWFLCLLVAGEW